MLFAFYGWDPEVLCLHGVPKVKNSRWQGRLDPEYLFPSQILWLFNAVSLHSCLERRKNMSFGDGGSSVTEGELGCPYVVLWPRKPEMLNPVLVTGHHLLTPIQGNAHMMGSGDGKQTCCLGLVPTVPASSLVHWVPWKASLKTAKDSISLLKAWDHYPQRHGCLTGCEHETVLGVW